MRAPRSLTLLAVALATTLAACGSTPARSAGSASGGPGPRVAASAPWPGYHGGGAHRGVAASMPAVKRVRVVARKSLDGEVYASPIAVSGTIVVATENDSVYGFGAGGRRKWRRHLGRPSPASQRPCGDIDPLGITGTPVYSARTGDVYVVAETGGRGRVRHTLVALSLATGKVRWRRSVDFPGRDVAAMQERGALAVAGGRVWVTFGGLAGDCGNYGGRLIGVPLSGRGRAARYNVPTAREAGMWQASGPAVDSRGRILVSVGNGAAGPGDRYDHSDSVLMLDTRAKLLDFFAPRSWASDNAGDVDLGSVGPALVGSRWVVQGGKSDRVYVLRQGRLGRIGGQVSVSHVCASYGGAAVKGSTVYLPCTDGVRALRVGKHGHLHVRWRFSPAVSGSPVVGGGRVWILDQDNGVLYGASPRTGRALNHVSVGATSRFATPALYGRLVLVPTLTGVTFVRTS